VILSVVMSTTPCDNVSDRRRYVALKYPDHFHRHVLADEAVRFAKELSSGLKYLDHFHRHVLADEAVRFAKELSVGQN